jgi:hypothetical protein
VIVVDLCSHCKAAFNGQADDDLQAEKVDKLFPDCACEEISVGVNSPGIIAADEFLYRMIISPSDIDSAGIMTLDSLRDVGTKGLSVFRDQASDEDISSLIIDRLTRKSTSKVKTVQAVLRVKASVLQERKFELGRLFCLYDETVPRRNPALPMVPTHATVLQRLHPPKTDGRKTKNKDGQKALYEIVKELKIDLHTFRGGLIAKLNQKSLEGAFVEDVAAA